MQKKIPQVTRADHQMNRSNSVTFGLQPYHSHTGYSTVQQEGPENFYERDRDYTLARTLSQNGFDVITEQSQADTEMSSQGRQSIDGYKRSPAKSFGKWNQKDVNTTESNWSNSHNQTTDVSQPKTGQVNKAINALKNYQLNVVVDLKNVMIDKENGNPNGRTLTTIADNQNYLNYRQSELPQRSTEQLYDRCQQPNQYDYKKKNITHENSAILADKYRNLQKSYDFLKNEINMLQQRQRKENIHYRQQIFYNHPQPQQQYNTQHQLHRSYNGQYQLESKPQHVTRQTRQAEKLRINNQELKHQLQEVYKLNRSYKRQAQLCLNTAQNLQNQLDSMKGQIAHLKDQNARLQDLYQSSVNSSKQINQKPQQAWPEEEDRTGELQSYIRELEAHIQSENKAKSMFMNEIIGYKLNYNTLEEENKRLRDMVRRCEVQHQQAQQSWTPTPTTLNVSEDTSNSHGYVCPYEKYGVPKLIISPPPEDNEPTYYDA